MPDRLLHVVCPSCTVVTRIPETRPAKEAKCGKCHGQLFPGKPVGYRRQLRTTREAQRHTGAGGFLGALVRTLPHDGAGL